MRKAIVVGLSALVSLGAGSLVSARSAADLNSQLSCPVPTGWDDVLGQKPRFAVFGELHGTEQAPRFVGNLVCAQALKGRPVLLAIEQYATLDAALQEAWALPSDRFAPALAKLGWEGRSDGVASKAMFDMLVSLHLLKERGLPIGIVAFSGAKDKEQSVRLATIPGQGAHEAAQAENIAKASETGNYALTIVLVGNLHARKLPVERRSVSYDPMAMRLSEQGKVISLEMAYGAGTSWNCLLKPDAKPGPGGSFGPDAVQCGPSPTVGTASHPGAPFIRLSAGGATQSTAYDGMFWVGPASASPPAYR